MNVISSLKNFGGSLKEQVVICKITTFLDTSCWFLLWKWFWIHYLPKQFRADVFAIKNCVVRRLMTPLHSTRAQGPKQVPNNLFWCSYCPRKVFAHPQTKSVSFKIVIFELQKSNFIKNCSKITILKFTLFVCGRAKNFRGQ